MGCPAPKIVSGGEGAALMKEPLAAAKVIGAVSRASGIPVTVKIRSGWDAAHINAPEIARIAQQEGARAVTVHARTRDQFYSGRADQSVIAAVVRAVDIPVIGNGDIASGEDALAMLRETGCAGVGVGRAARGNPWLFREIACRLRGEAFAPPSIRGRLELAMRHLDMLAALLGEARRPGDARPCGQLRPRGQGLRAAARASTRWRALTTCAWR